MSFFATAVTYASPSSLNSTRERAELGLAANAERPVAFHALVKPEHAFLLRVALRALGQAIWSEDHWASDGEHRGRVLDPVITVHPDRLWFEAFTQDLGAYVSLQVDPSVFDTLPGAPPPQYGTTNVDFSAWLWGALGELRSSRRTALRVGPEGFELRTEAAGGRFEQKVELPENWLRAFLQVQGAMAMPGTRLQLQPVDLLAALRFLQHNKAKVSPRALRYELEPGRPAVLCIEPFEHRITLEGCEHGHTTPRSIRTWGRRKLKLIEPLLPFATQVDVYLKGRALPSFYAVHLPGMRFVIGLTGLGAGKGFDAGFDLLSGLREAPEAHQQQVLPLLAQRHAATSAALAEASGLSLAQTTQALTALARAGRAMFDVEARAWRHRELFSPPIDTARLFPPDPRREAAERLLTEVRELSVQAEEQRIERSYRDPASGETVKRERTHRQWRVAARVGQETPQIVISDEERIVFGQCSCPHFQAHLLNQGPCEHMLAVFEASAGERGAG